MKTQTRARFDQELRAVQDNILRLGGMVDAAIDQSIRCLAERDSSLAHEIIKNDAKINELRYKIEVECLTVTALHQPLAGDLRFLVAALIIVSELERMADHAAGIAKIVLRMGDEPLLKPLIDMPRMVQTCRGMLSKASKHVSPGAGLATPPTGVVSRCCQQVRRNIVVVAVCECHRRKLNMTPQALHTGNRSHRCRWAHRPTGMERLRVCSRLVLELGRGKQLVELDVRAFDKVS